MTSFNSFSDPAYSNRQISYPSFRTSLDPVIDTPAPSAPPLSEDPFPTPSAPTFERVDSAGLEALHGSDPLAGFVSDSALLFANITNSVVSGGGAARVGTHGVTVNKALMNKSAEYAKDLMIASFDPSGGVSLSPLRELSKEVCQRNIGEKNFFRTEDGPNNELRLFVPEQMSSAHREAIMSDARLRHPDRVIEMHNMSAEEVDDITSTFESLFSYLYNSQRAEEEQRKIDEEFEKMMHKEPNARSDHTLSSILEELLRKLERLESKDPNKDIQDKILKNAQLAQESSLKALERERQSHEKLEVALDKERDFKKIEKEKESFSLEKKDAIQSAALRKKIESELSK